MEGNIKYYKNEYDIVCYCLMDNHVHLLLHTYDKHINYFMKRINSIYPRYFNNKYNSSMILNYFNVSDRRKEYKSFVEQVIRDSGNSDKLELIRK